MTRTTRPRSRTGPLACIERGAGPLVLLIHGVGLRAEACGGQIDVLSKTCRVLAVDLPGHGESAAFETEPVLADFTDRIAARLDRPAILIGHSFGAMIATDMAIRHRDRVAGVAALNAIYRRDPEARRAVQARAGSLGGMTVADPTATLARWFGTSPSGARQACDHWLRSVHPAGYRDAYRIFARLDGPPDPALTALAAPTLFVTGGREPNSTPAMSAP